MPDANSALTVVPLSDLKPGDKFYLIDPDDWMILKPTEYRDVVVVENMRKGIIEARMGRADARLVVVKSE